MASSNPMVFVIAEPEVHAALRRCADLTVWDTRFGSTDEFSAAASNRRIPTDIEPTVIVVADTHTADLAGFLATFGPYAAVIPWIGRGSEQAAAQVATPVTLNGLRTAIGVVAEQPLPDDVGGDVTLEVKGRQSAPAGELRPVTFAIDNTPTPPAERGSLTSLLGGRAGDADTAAPVTPLRPAEPSPSWSGRWEQSIADDEQRERDLAANLGFTDNKDPSQCHVVCVFSSKGGVGKTTMTVNLATRLARVTGLKVAMMDLDVGFGDIGPRIGRYQPTVVDLMRGGQVTPAMLDSLPTEPTTGVAAVLAPLRADTGGHATVLHPGSYGRLLDAMRRRFDAVFLDCSVELSDPIISEFAMPSATSIAFVVNNERATIIDARRALTTMCQGVNEEPPGLGLKRDHIALVVNQLVDNVGITQAELGALLEGWPIAAVVPDNRQLWVGEANSRRLLSTSQQADVLAALDDALRWLVPGVHIPQGNYPTARPAAATDAPQRKGFLSKLLGRDR